ncbi:hypothetical protein BURMUCF2_2114 [Burkholderia multivorans CF2]|nr:hypothetical protein BURMUCF2_2114 [Burkholderia multivorans CF2]
MGGGDLLGGQQGHVKLLESDRVDRGVKGTALGNLAATCFVQRSNGAYFRAEKILVKHFLCIAQSRQIIDKTTAYRRVPESVSAAVHAGAGRVPRRAAHHDRAQVNRARAWNVMLMSVSKSAPFRHARPWRRAFARAEPARRHAGRGLRSNPALKRLRSDVISINRVVIGRRPLSRRIDDFFRWERAGRSIECWRTLTIRFNDAR